jgi:hypothetical protein
LQTRSPPSRWSWSQRGQGSRGRGCQQHGAVIVIQQFLQKIERFDIEIVRRCVEDQKGGFFGHQFGQEQPRLFPARQRPDRCAGLCIVKQEILEIGDDMLGRAPHHHLIGPAANPHRRVTG